MKAGFVVLIGLLVLSGCSGEPKQDAGAGTAQGEVLPGAVSDAMLPLDTVRSQAPLAPQAEGGDAGDVRGAKPGKASAKPSDPAVIATPEVKPEASASAAGSPTTN